MELEILKNPDNGTEFQIGDCIGNGEFSFPVKDIEACSILYTRKIYIKCKYGRECNKCISDMAYQSYRSNKWYCSMENWTIKRDYNIR